jgi:7,8-dihydropterin-6-yl-methyl-4-(beta-D-ribofuranosyl)aminobenzene 5'-phosphate synthase
VLNKEKMSSPEFANHRIIVDLHQDRPIARGLAPPPKFDKVIGRLPEDPTFDEIEAAGGKLELHNEPGEKGGHVAANGTVWVSGEVPRKFEFEEGIKGGSRWLKEGKWALEEVTISAVHIS